MSMRGVEVSHESSDDDEPIRASFKRPPPTHEDSDEPVLKRRLLDASVEEDAGTEEEEPSPQPTGLMLSTSQGSDHQLHQTYGPGFKLLQRAGYKAGSGLGKEGSGRVEPVGLSTQKGRRGLGAARTELDTDYSQAWDFGKEDAVVEETVSWCPPSELDPPSLKQLAQWITVGKKKLTIDDETQFLESPRLLAELLEAKNVFDELSDRDLHNARSRANPYETIKTISRGGKHRAAVKMANMDAVFGWLFTKPEHPHSDPQEQKEWVPSESEGLFYFADVCAGPGGFTEYVLWKKGWSAHGFGMTLKGDCDFRLDNFLAAPSQMFETFYGESGTEGDGDVTNPHNLKAFENFVKNSTQDGEGCHLFMADGGFSVAGKENIQEILSKRIYLCQFLCGISVLRPGGNFVCKLFDLFTEFSMGLVYLFYRCFEQLSIHKPHTSRPANSERYIVCKNLLPTGSSAVVEYLHIVNEKLDSLAKEKSEDDVVSIVPVDVMEEDEGFWAYMRESNTKLAVRQRLYLDKYKAFAKNPTLMEPKQEDLRARCLHFWDLPDKTRPDQSRPTPRGTFSQLVGEEHAEWMPRAGRRGVPLTALAQLTLTSNVPGLDYRISPVCEDSAHLILATGRNFIFIWEGSRWEPLGKVKLFLPKDTLLFGELTFLHRGQKKGLMKRHVLRVFDAHTLSGINVSQLPFHERQEKIRKFAWAISHKHSIKEAAEVVVAETWLARDLVRQKARWRILNVKGTPRLALFTRALSPDMEEAPRDNEYLVLKGLFLHRSVSEPWRVCWSKSGGREYYWRPPSGGGDKPVSIFPLDWAREPSIVLPFPETMAKRMWWDFGANSAEAILSGEDKTKLSFKSFYSFVA